MLSSGIRPMTMSQAASKFIPHFLRLKNRTDILLPGRQVVPMLDQRQVLLDFEFDKSQSGLKLILARELESSLFVFTVGVFHRY